VKCSAPRLRLAGVLLAEVRSRRPLGPSPRPFAGECHPHIEADKYHRSGAHWSRLVSHDVPRSIYYSPIVALQQLRWIRSNSLARGRVVRTAIRSVALRRCPRHHRGHRQSECQDHPCPSCDIRYRIPIYRLSRQALMFVARQSRRSAAASTISWAKLPTCRTYVARYSDSNTRSGINVWYSRCVLCSTVSNSFPCCSCMYRRYLGAPG
jgi:hypothetical protein